MRLQHGMKRGKKKKTDQMPCWHWITTLNFASGDETTVLTKHMLLCAFLCEVLGCCVHVFAPGEGVWGGVWMVDAYELYLKLCLRFSAMCPRLESPWRRWTERWIETEQNGLAS